jgi:RNA polymerase sigma-70 factor (ECF subfamily)
VQHIALVNIPDKKETEESLNIETDFTYIFETYYKRVYNYIFYRVNSCREAEDLTSQVFEKIMAKIGTYCEEKSQFEVWVFSISRNVINDYFREIKKHKVFSIDSFKDLISNKKDPEDIVESRETNDELLNALKVLDARERNVIALKFGANLKNTEIAEILKLSESNIGVILYRTMKKLRKELGEGNKCEQKKH